MLYLETLAPIGAIILPILAIWLSLSFFFRRVVKNNEVHIVQHQSTTKVYGGENGSGNVYYEWPSSWPFIGVSVIKLPIINFDLTLLDYEAYDEDRVPFDVDVTAFFRINNPEVAARRVKSVETLKHELSLIVQGAVRKVLASDKIDGIMLERSKFGDAFTAEVSEQLQQWGVTSVKSMELMDIRDAKDSEVIQNIMAKKTSEIERDSRITVAENNRAAEESEIEATRQIDLSNEQALQAVGERRAEKDQAVGIASEKSKQAVAEQAATTAEKDMAVKRVEKVKAAEIAKDEAVVKAEEEAQAKVIAAEATLTEEKRKAEGVKVNGDALAAAQAAMEMAPVTAQIELAQEIGSNDGYMAYLQAIKAIEGNVVVGSAQAAALEGADLKVIANSGDVKGGVNSVMDLFTPKGGTSAAGALEAFAQSPTGQALLANFIGGEAVTPTEAAPKSAASDKDASKTKEKA